MPPVIVRILNYFDMRQNPSQSIYLWRSQQTHEVLSTRRFGVYWNRPKDLCFINVNSLFWNY